MDWEAFYNSFRSPDFIPGYEIQNRLGGGAFGDVYKARKQSIGKPYAIKFLKIEDDGQREAVERELSQVRHFAAIDHPNLVTIEDMGTVMGVPYLIMGYAGEDTLARRLKTGALDRDEALLYFTQACRGVLALHDRRLVHFDLKPSNIFLKGEVARVGDYGLSKLLTDGRMTLSFGRGTPQYMAPEILRNRADHRADIYSLGVILFESLVGELPFQPGGEGGLVLREEDHPPTFPADFPAVLRPPVECCLRLAPEHRFQDMGQLMEAIGQTARQGDSVVVDWSSIPAAPAVSAGADGDGRAVGDPPGAEVGETGKGAEVGEGGEGTEVGEGGEGTEGGEGGEGGEDLRHTAADLARGAVEVARGVWEGLTAREKAQGSAQGPAPGSDPDPVRGRRDTVRKRLRGAREDVVTAGRGVAAAGRSVRDGVKGVSRVLRTRRERRRGRRRGGAAEATRTPALVGGPGDRAPGGGGGMSPPPEPRPATGPAAAGTVPVPPRVAGGVFGALISSGVVAIEVLAAMLANLLRGVVRLFHFLVDHLLRGGGGLVVRVLRVGVFFLLMAVLGFSVMMVGMVFLDALGAQP